MDVVSGSTTWLYWREAYYPNWHAYLNDGNGEREIPIYRAGPGFMLMPIDTTAESVSVSLEWQSALIERAAIAASLLGIILLMAIVIDGLFLGGNGLTWIKIAFTMRLPKPFLDEETQKDVAERNTIGAVSHGSTSSELTASKEMSQSIEIPVETQLSDEQEKLLKTWLDDKNHEDDPWVNKVLDPDQRK